MLLQAAADYKEAKTTARKAKCSFPGFFLLLESEWGRGRGRGRVQAAGKGAGQRVPPTYWMALQLLPY